VHIPDGFIDGPTSLGGAAVAAVGLSVTARKAAHTLDDQQIPLAGLTAAFIFSMQMINVPVANGTSGHLLGGVLAAILVGPWAATLCATVVLLAQSLFFADGGISAIGLNLTGMALLAPLVGYPLFVAVRRMLPATRASVSAASAIAGFAGMLAAVLGFVAFYAVGGTGDVPIGTVAGAMVGVHVFIALLEGALTALVVSAVVSTRPDLVYGARDLVPVVSARPEPAILEQVGS
jgi:cobalt/nickel transport system permease protein